MVFSLVLGAGAYHLVSNPSLFVFRQGGTGASGDGPSDKQFTEQQKARPAHHPPKPETVKLKNGAKVKLSPRAVPHLGTVIYEFSGF